jgi:hypothetical protein
MADAFEGMRSSFAAAQPGRRGCRRTASRKAPAGVDTIAESFAGSPGSGRGVVSAEILSSRRGCGRAPILLTQRGFPVGHASAVDRVVCPRSSGRIVIIEVIDGHHIDPTMWPIEGAEEEAGSHSDAGTPHVADLGTREIAGPGSPKDRRIGRPPPRAIDDRGIVVGDIHDLWIRRCDRNVLSLLVDTNLVVRLERAVGRRALT